MQNKRKKIEFHAKTWSEKKRQEAGEVLMYPC
jgi:hypothetical protein